MATTLDHVMVLSHNKVEAGEFLARILNAPCGEANVGPFFAVYINDSLTIDFDEVAGPYPIQHLCFRVADAEFDGVLERIKMAGIAFRSMPNGPDDRTINTHMGGRILYWTAPDGHIWEVLTKSYARQATGVGCS
jgi:catechol 2,3-dioxygenase-like lactoylglutathione lyase family enzyme